MTSRGSSAVTHAAEAAGRYAHQTIDQVRERYDRAEGVVRHNPARSVAAVFGLGLAAELIVTNDAQRLAFDDVDRFVLVSPDSDFLDPEEPEALEAFAPLLDFADDPFASVVFRPDEVDPDFFGATLDFTAAAADLATGSAAATPAAAATVLPAVDRDLPSDDLPRAPEEELFRLAEDFDPRDPVTEGSDSLTFS